MIDYGSLISPNNPPPNDMTVTMAVEIEGKHYYMLAVHRDGKWVSHKPGVNLPPKLLGWTGMDTSWGHRNK